MDTLDGTPLLKRRLVWDIIDHEDVSDVIRSCGLIPGSPGGDAMEHYQSHVRLAALYPVEEVVNVFSELAGEVLYGATLDDQDPDEEDDPEMEEYYRSTATYAIRGVIANLIDAGILHVNEGLL